MSLSVLEEFRGGLGMGRGGGDATEHPGGT